jgi:hypothetical protein
MLNPSNPREVRAFFRDAWAAAQAGRVLTPLEDLVADVVAMHPECHALLAAPDLLERDDASTSALFLHLSLHVAVREAIGADRPPGARAVYEALRARGSATLAVEHALLDGLHEELTTAARAGHPPDPARLLAAWNALL